MENTKIYYSKSTLGFYNNIIHKTMPDDVIEITEEEYKVLFDGQANGKIISPDETGRPILKDIIVSEKDKILNQIYILEGSVSERRKQEAICGDADSIAYIANIRNQIYQLKLLLPKS